MERIQPLHPGEILLTEYMKPFGLSQYRVARDIGVSPILIGQIVQGKRAITAHTAIRLARYLGTSPEIWVTMQARYDLAVAQHALGAQIEKEVRVFKAV